MLSVDTADTAMAAFLLTVLNNYKSTNQFWSQKNAEISISIISADLETVVTLDMKP
mgnify:CR=1 FL=1